jgi:hypothetical protein
MSSASRLDVRFLCCAILLFATRLVQAETNVSSVGEIPLQFREGLLWVEIDLPHRKEPLLFLVDSGASVSVLDLSTAKRLGLPLGPKVNVQAVATRMAGHWPVKASAKAGVLELPGEFLALDLSKLSGACSRRVEGLLGADFFRGRVIQIDYRAERLRLLDALPTGEGMNPIPLETRPCGFRVAVNVNGGKSQWVRVDTGCATALQWVTSKERADRCTSKLAIGLTELTIPQSITSVRIGHHYLNTVPTGLHRKPIFPGESGLIGNDLLARFGLVTIDAKAGRLILGRGAAE